MCASPPAPSIDEDGRARAEPPRQGRHREGAHVHVLVLGDNSHGIAHALIHDMERAFPKLCLDYAAKPKDFAPLCRSMGEGDRVALGLVTSEVPSIDQALVTIGKFPCLKDTNWMVYSDRQSHDDLTIAVESGRLSSVASVPWTVRLLLGQSYDVMVRSLIDDGLEESQVVDLIGEAPPTAVTGPLLAGLDLPEERMIRHLLDGVERVLGPRPRILVPEGVDLTRQGEPVPAVHLVLEGHVALRRDTDRGEVLLHHATSGPLIGLVSLAQSEDAFFTSTTTIASRVIRLTNEQLQLVLAHEPEMSAVLAVLAIQSLTRRLIRAEHLHVEKELLSVDLEIERARLARALEDLRRTRAELVERARFAMLGELSAGIAHELNNPVAALARSAEHLGEDVDNLMAGDPALSEARVSMQQALNAHPRSTADERALIRSLMDVVGGDRTFARRLVNAGVTTPEEARRLRTVSHAELEAIETGARIGSSVRAVRAASSRVVDLTASLKGYARPEAESLSSADVREGLDDVLRLVKHRLHGIEVERLYGDVPDVLAHPSKLQQVWTNLLVNAAEAIEDEGEDLAEGVLPARGSAAPGILIAVSEDDQRVKVEITDNGPGIPTELVERIFEPHFTTKAGRVRYGLGMGMSISRSIVAESGGTMEVDSHPGRTRVRVLLPIAPPDHPTSPESKEQK